MALARRDPELGARVGRLDAGVPRHGHRHGQAHHRRASRGAAPPARPPRPVGGGQRWRGSSARRWRRSPTSRRGAGAPCSSGGTALYVQAIVDELDIPGQYPEVRAELDAEPDTAALHARLHALDPLAADRMEPANRRRVVRALEVTLGQRSAVLDLRAGTRRAPARRRSPWSACGARPTTCGPASRRGTASSSTPASSTRSAACTTTRGGCPARPPRPSGTSELHEHLTAEVPLDVALDLAVRRTGRFARRQWAWFRRDPRITWLDLGPGEEANLLVDDLARTVG